MQGHRGWFLAGLFFTTLATLTLEILDTRLLSVLTWYHLSFFAVSIAMFGMAAGAVHVYLGGTRFEKQGAVAALSRYGSVLAVTIAASHLVNLCIPLPADPSASAVLALGITTIVLALPFYVSGLLVSIALTRIPGSIGLVYAVDLLGASLGSLLILLLLALGNITSTAFICASLAAMGAACFRRFAREGRIAGVAAMATVLAVLAVLNSTTAHPLRVLYPKGSLERSARIAHEFWSIHGQVLARRPVVGQPFYWAAGVGTPEREVETISMAIDGAAGTSMTRWDGKRSSLAWVQYDVTSLPYHLRPNGDAAVIGVGGGRDVLSALWAGSRSVVGIEINRGFMKLLRETLRDFANLVPRPDVRLVHDEARSYLTRSGERYDVLQMSLIDTWAATGAGAFTLSENGLYTVEAWDVFLGTLKPGGIFSVSRWYAPERASETSRLVALATAALLRRGVADPSAQLALISRDRIATLLVSSKPFTPQDLGKLKEVSERMGFDPLVMPGRPASNGLLGRIVASDSQEAILRAVADEPFDYTPPTDEAPYFFNLVKPSTLLTVPGSFRGGGVVRGNMIATLTLAALMGIVAVLVATVIFAPLLRSGLPDLSPTGFGFAVLYFALIGAGFMLIQIAFMQRFSVYLGHPTYAIAVILFSMILATGVGSYLSDRIPVEHRALWLYAMPLGTALVILAITLSIQPVLQRTIHLGLLPRCLLVVCLVAPISLLLGIFFPMGMRLVERLSSNSMPWMWGVNGACAVLASVAAVAISMWLGIQMSFYVAIAGYALLALPATVLFRQGRAHSPGSSPEAVTRAV